MPRSRSRSRLARLAPLALAALTLATLVAACGSGGTARVVAPAEAVGMLSTRTVIDVRTPEEFAAGHVVGALNINVEAPDFADRIASLDKAAPYLVYCRTGRRSAIAVETMKGAGFTDLVDAKGLAELMAAGAPVE